MGFFGGFPIVLRQAFRKKITGKYPERKREKPARTHGRHVLGRYEDGMEKCVGCELCASVCPAQCIYVRGKENPADAPVSPGERYGFVYEINYLRCIHCDLCVEACPTEAITESKLFEFSFTNRDDAIYQQDQLLIDDEGNPQQFPWEHWANEKKQPALAEFERKQTSEWMRVTADAGRGSDESVVRWSGDLGYGVRPAEPGQAVRDSAENDQVQGAAGAAGPKGEAGASGGKSSVGGKGRKGFNGKGERNV